MIGIKWRNCSLKGLASRVGNIWIEEAANIYPNIFNFLFNLNILVKKNPDKYFFLQPFEHYFFIFFLKFAI